MLRSARFRLAGLLVGLAIRVMPDGKVRDGYRQSINDFEEAFLRSLDAEQPQ